MLRELLDWMLNISGNNYQSFCGTYEHHLKIPDK